MSKWIAINTLILLMVSSVSVGQQLGTSWLFRPGLRMHFEDIVPQGDNVKGQEVGVAYIVPLSGKVSVDLESLKLDIKQHFFQVGLTHSTTHYATLNSESWFTGKLGFSGMMANMSKGVWAYSAQVQMNQFSDNSQLFTGYAGIVKIRVRGIHKQDVYGLGMVYTGSKLWPVPLFGMRRKLDKHLFLNFLLPSKVELSWHPEKRWWFLASTSWKAKTWNAYLPPVQTFELTNTCDRAHHTYTALRNTLEIRYRVPNKFPLWIRASGGVDAFANIDSNCFDESVGRKVGLDVLPYFNAGIQFDLGKSFIPASYFGDNW